MKIVTRIGITAAALVTVGITPIVPEEMKLLYSYQQELPLTAVVDVAPVETSGSTSAPIIEREPQPEFEDTDGNGLISVSVFQDHAGNKVYIQIPDALYQKMGKLNGASFNPKRNEYLSLFESFVSPAPVDAAIAFDASSSGSAAASSLTVAHTVTGSNTFMAVAIRDLDNTLTGITYNSVALTKTGTTLSGGGNNFSMWYLFGPSTGNNNIVATKSSGTSNIKLSAGSFNGVSQAGLDASGENTGGSGLSFTQSLTSVADNAWMIGNGGNNGGSTYTQNGDTLIVADNLQIIIGYEGPISPAGSNTIGFTKSSDQPDLWASHVISIAPATAAAASPQDDGQWFQVFD